MTEMITKYGYCLPDGSTSRDGTGFKETLEFKSF